MPALDFHAVSSSGNTSALTNGTTGGLNTILLGGDGQTVYGVPIAPQAVLAYWGIVSTAADTLLDTQLNTQDQWDPINGEHVFFGASSIIPFVNRATWIPYRTGQRQLAIRQNTGAANCMGYTLDWSPNPYNRVSGSPLIEGVMKSKHIPNVIELETTFGGALTAITWGNQAFAPTTAIPNGYYVILGATVNALGAAGTAWLRFRHADFGLFRPGFPVLDQTNIQGDAATNASSLTVARDELLLYPGYQFVHLSKVLGSPVMPVFRATNAGTGLSFDVASITADTPQVIVRIAKVADLNAVIS